MTADLGSDEDSSPIYSDGVPRPDGGGSDRGDALVRGEWALRSFVVRDGRIYWMALTRDWRQMLRSCDPARCRETARSADTGSGHEIPMGTVDAARLRVAGDQLYLGNENGIDSCSTNGCTSRRSVAQGSGVGDFVVEGGSLFYAEGSRADACDGADCAATTTLVADMNPEGSSPEPYSPVAPTDPVCDVVRIVADSDWLYVATGERIRAHSQGRNE